MMLSIILLVAICADDKLYVATDNGRNSKCLISDLNRNWLDKSRGEPTELSYELLDISCRLSQNIVLIDNYDFKGCDKHRVPRFSSYPRYRIGEYREFVEFDHRAFSSAGYPTMTTLFSWEFLDSESVIHNQVYQLPLVLLRLAS